MHAPDLAATRVGDPLPSVTFGPISRATLALYAGASGDHNPIHIDSDMAKTAGMADVFAQGMLSYGVLTRVPSNWAGSERLRSFVARFVSMVQVHDLITCSGTVIELIEQDGASCARVELVATAQDGRKTLTGEAIVSLS